MSGEESNTRLSRIFLDPYEPALVVEYVTESYNHQNGQVSREHCEAKIWLRMLDVNTNILNLAKTIVKKSHLLSDQQIQEVKAHIEHLYERQFPGEAKFDALDNTVYSQVDVAIERIDEYLELLYGGDLKNVLDGTEKILYLCLNVGNLSALIQNYQLMSALSRVLSEDFTRSLELSFNICRIFLAFSNFSEMHDILAKYRVGALVMRVLDLEVKRNLHLQHQEPNWRFEHGRNPPCQQSASVSDTVHMKRKDHVIFVSLHVLMNLADDIDSERKMTKKGLVEVLCHCLSCCSQDCLRIVLAFLRKLSVFEDNTAEMVKLREEAIPRAVRLLGSSDVHIVHSTLCLLFNLSFNMQSKDLICFVRMPQLVGLLQIEQLRGKTLQILYHMSSCAQTTRELSIKTNVVEVMMELIRSFPQKRLSKELAAFAINMSLDPFAAEQIMENEGVKVFLTRIKRYHDLLLVKVLRNLSEWTYQLQCKLDTVKEQVEQSVDKRLVPGTKLNGKQGAHIVDMSSYKGRQFWDADVIQIIKLIKGTECQVCLSDLLGILKNLTQHDLPVQITWHDLMADFSLDGFVSKLLLPGMSDNDVALETLVLTGQLCVDEHTSSLLASSNVVQHAHDLWRENFEEDEFSLQMLVASSRFLLFPETRKDLLHNSEGAIDRILECSRRSKNGRIKDLAKRCLYLVLEFDRLDDGSCGEFGAKIQRSKYHDHNKEWICVKS